MCPFTGVGLHGFVVAGAAPFGDRGLEAPCELGEYGSAPMVFDSSVRVAGTGRVDG
jgi:hypothetical protein